MLGCAKQQRQHHLSYRNNMVTISCHRDFSVMHSVMASSVCFLPSAVSWYYYFIQAVSWQQHYNIIQYYCTSTVLFFPSDIHLCSCYMCHGVHIKPSSSCTCEDSRPQTTTRKECHSARVTWGR